MIRKLRRRFVILAMTAVFVLLAVIITGINILNWNSVVRSSQKQLELLSLDRGFGPSGPSRPEPRPEHEGERYFSVILPPDSDKVYVENNRYSAIDTQNALTLTQKALARRQDTGFIGQLRYRVSYKNGVTQVVFLDCSRSLDTFRSFLLISIFSALGGFSLVFFFVFFLSGRIIRPIAESYEKQKRFITDAGHELKTPLTIIHADADVLAMELGENEWLEDIQKQARQLSELTNDLVLLSRMEEEDHKLSMIEFPFSEVVAETAASFLAPAQTKNQSFTQQIAPLLTLKGNEKAIRQMVMLLLENAVKYTPEGGKILLGAERQGKQLKLWVENTTQAPIPKESIPLLFDRFYRVDPSRNSQSGGTGIGLSVVKAIVTAHGGKITATGTETTLTITASFS